MIIRGATLIGRPAVIIAVLFAITACSGGGGGSSFDSPDDSSGCSFFCPDDDDDGGGDSAPSVSLAALTSTTPGLLYTSAVEANDTDGATYTGNVAVANFAQTELEGVLVTPRETAITLTNEFNSDTLRETSYFDDSGFLVSRETPSLACTVSSSDKLPASVSVGDSGLLSSLTCNNNSIIQTSNWDVLDAGEGDIALVISITSKDRFDVTVSTETTTFTLDASGVIVSFKSVITQTASGYELTVQSI
jgi:hypothetical protein